MKKHLFATGMIVSAVFISCGNETGTAGTTTTTTTSDTAATAQMNNTQNMNTPMMGADSTFVLEAASSGLMEVEAGNLAQQNARNQRVKDFAAMMVRDHQQANQELRSLVGNRMMLPDTMTRQHREHVDRLRNAGNNFDKQYMDMMVQAHNQDVTKFERAAGSLNDQQLRSWAERTLPILRTHRDSAQAINRGRL